MKKSVFNVALAILISLGVVACKSTDNPVKETPKELKKPEGGKTEGGKTEGGKTEGGNAEGDKEDKSGTPSLNGFEENSPTDKIKYIKDKNIPSSARGGAQPAGTIVAGHAKTYAAYAVIRKANNSNEYITYQTNFTPISQKDYVAALDATYKGKASFTATVTGEKIANDVDTMDLTFNVKDNYISGTGNGSYMEGNRKVDYQGNFAKAAITVLGDNSKLVFTGTYTVDGMIKNGTYQGYFAGDKAQNVVGKIEAEFVEEGKTNTLKGAFVAEKQ